MDQFSKEELKDLLTHSGEQCVSLYLPAHGNPFEAREDQIRFKNLQKEAEEALIHRGLRPPEARELLAPLQRLADDHSLWQYQPNGLVVFLSSGLLRYFRLPMQFEELVVVARRFHLKPLLPLFTEDYGFFVLAISQNKIQLYEGNRFQIWEKKLENVPKSLDVAINYDEPERQFQFKSKAPVGAGGRHAVVFAHGAGLENPKEDIRRYLLQVDRGLQEVLRQEKRPLVLAGVEYLLPLYREVNSYPHLLEEGISGNPELLRPDDLHTLAWQKVEPFLLKARAEVLSQYSKLAGAGRTSDRIEEILPAAVQGRVYKLLDARDAQIWGTFLSEQGTVLRHDEQTAGSEDLLDLAAIQTIMNGGMVYMMEKAALPDESSIAAIFRY